MNLCRFSDAYGSLYDDDCDGTGRADVDAALVQTNAKRLMVATHTKIAKWHKICETFFFIQNI